MSPRGLWRYIDVTVAGGVEGGEGAAAHGVWKDLGTGTPNAYSELLDRTGPALDPAWPSRVVHVHED